MALHSELPVYRDTYQMLLRIYALTQDFGREFKYTLGQDMKRDSLQLVRCIHRANRSASVTPMGPTTPLAAAATVGLLRSSLLQPPGTAT